ncbi:MAG: ribonuclease P protein component [Pseudobacteriovorax sp.]|nr:ribonuclease P protein component [Pseudobacteriovorax sp.]
MLSFPKSSRLLSRMDFRSVLSVEKAKVVNPYMVVIAKPRNSSEPSRLGLIVSKKVGIAVMRNRVKRKLRESFRTLPSPKTSLDLVIIARKSAVSADFNVIKDSLGSSLDRLVRKLEPK